MPPGDCDVGIVCGPDRPDGCLQTERAVNGERRWSWRIHWSGDGIPVADACAVWGSDAVLKMTADVLDGGLSDLAFEAPCTEGELIVELPSKWVFHGEWMVVSAATGRASKRQNINQDVHCAHDLYFTVWPPQP